MSHEGLTFDVDDRGPRTGETVVLLHGWPQDRTAWDEVVEDLTAAGLRTVAVDLRGYSPGARPPSYRDYAIDELVGDVIAVADEAVGPTGQVHVVGHDWGGALAWATAGRYPERLASLTVLSTPHPRAMGWAMRHGDQRRRSWYMVFFAVPVLPAALLRRFARPLLMRLGLPKEQAEHYASRLRRPGAAAASLAWYRAALTPRRRRGERPRRVGRGEERSVPTTYVWGSRDPALGRAAAERTAAWMEGELGEQGRFVELEAGHWLPETRPAEVSEAILDRVGRRGRGARAS